MARVYKYPVHPVVELPKGSTILSVQIKEDGVFLYAQVPDKVSETEKHFFNVVATGEEFDDTNAKYIGSFILQNYYIYHVYEILQSNGGGQHWISREEGA